MIFAIIITGILLIVSALKNTQHKLGEQLALDVLGKDGFLLWAICILAIGAIGWIPGLKPASRNLLWLLLVVILVRNGGIWANAETALQSASALGPAPSVAPKPLASQSSGSATTSAANGSASSGGGSDSTLSTIETVAAIAAFL